MFDTTNLTNGAKSTCSHSEPEKPISQGDLAQAFRESMLADALEQYAFLDELNDSYDEDETDEDISKTIEKENYYNF